MSSSCDALTGSILLSPTKYAAHGIWRAIKQCVGASIPCKRRLPTRGGVQEFKLEFLSRNDASRLKPRPFQGGRTFGPPPMVCHIECSSFQIPAVVPWRVRAELRHARHSGSRVWRVRAACSQTDLQNKRQRLGRVWFGRALSVGGRRRTRRRALPRGSRACRAARRCPSSS